MDEFAKISKKLCTVYLKCLGVCTYLLKPALASWYGRQFSELSWHKTEGERIDGSPLILQSVIVHKEHYGAKFFMKKY